jgi:predicted transcriptional regulator
MTIRLDPELKSGLNRLSAATHRSKSYLAAAAVREYIETNEWQINEIQKALREADAEDFASTEEVEAVINKWG